MDQDQSAVEARDLLKGVQCEERWTYEFEHLAKLVAACDALGLEYEVDRPRARANAAWHIRIWV